MFTTDSSAAKRASRVEEEDEEEDEKYHKQVHIDWHTHYAALLEYMREHGHCNVPYSDKYECDLEGFDVNGGTYHYHGALGNWLTRQCRYHRGVRGLLAPDRAALLQKLVDQGE